MQPQNPIQINNGTPTRNAQYRSAGGKKVAYEQSVNAVVRSESGFRESLPGVPALQSGGARPQECRRCPAESGCSSPPTRFRQASIGANRSARAASLRAHRGGLRPKGFRGPFPPRSLPGRARSRTRFPHAMRSAPRHRERPGSPRREGTAPFANSGSRFRRQPVPRLPRRAIAAKCRPDKAPGRRDAGMRRPRRRVATAAAQAACGERRRARFWFMEAAPPQE